MQEWLNWPLSKSGEPATVPRVRIPLSPPGGIIMTEQKQHTISTAQPSQESGLAIASLVLGIVSMTGPGLLLGIPAIITGALALKRKLAGRGLAIAGLVTGIISTVLSLLFIAFVVFIMIWGMMRPQDFAEPQTPSQLRDSSNQQDTQPFDSSRT